LWTVRPSLLARPSHRNWIKVLVGKALVVSGLVLLAIGQTLLRLSPSLRHLTSPSGAKLWSVVMSLVVACLGLGFGWHLYLVPAEYNHYKIHPDRMLLYTATYAAVYVAYCRGFWQRSIRTAKMLLGIILEIIRKRDK